MMDSCLAGKPDRFELVEVDDIKRNLLDEFSVSPAHVSAPPQTENLQVYLRVRPYTAAESHSRDSQDCVTIEGSDTVALRAPRISSSNQKNEKPLPQTAQRFTFTQVFGPEAGQRQVFNGSVRGLVRDVLQGGNCLVFTYGVTNAGKTFTFLGPEHDSGLLPRSLSVIFNSIEDRLYSRNDLKPQRCKDFSRLTTEQQVAENSSKRSLLRLFKETDKMLISGRSTFLEGSSLSSDSSISEADSFCLDVSSNIRFSVWVSFCEIYNETIHDLLEQVPAVNQRRTVLRLSQDVKGNSFIKDLRWVQVNSSEEAYRIMKIGKRNQSFSSTRLNYLSSRSHSIFSIRILRVDDSSLPRVLGVSELALCDLAGSERCSRTQNTGERLKEAGNINSSLLTLGKCINAMRLNQNSKFQHHVPFRESKLTHFLQNFFCGVGRVSMVVNINQSSSFFDETLNVLKFSALAQKVVVLSSQPEISGDLDPHKKAMELSIVIDEAEERRNQLRRGRKSSLIAWETSLEDLQEDEDGEEEDSMMEETVLEAGGEGEGEEEEVDLTMGDEEQHPDREAALRLVLEAQIREEVSTEFMELFKKMEKDYSERLEKEREILEERADKKVEILMKMVGKTVDPSVAKTDGKEENQKAALEEDISSMSEEREKIQEGAQSGHYCVAKETQTAEMEELQLKNQRSHDQLQETLQSLEQQEQKFRELIQVCRQKEEVIVRLQAAVEKAAADKEHTCSCMRGVRAEEVKEESCKRQRDSTEESGGPAKKRVLLEKEIWRLQEENENKEKVIAELQKREERRRSLEEEVRRRNEEVKQLKEEQELLEQKVLMLTDLDACQNCTSVLASLEAEQRESARLQKENKALVNGIFQLQTEVTGLQEQLNQQTVIADSLSEQLNTAKSRLQDLESQLEEKSESVSSFRQEVERLKLRVKEEEGQRTSLFHATMEELTKESQAALQRSAEKSQQIEELQGEKIQLKDQLKQSLNSREELSSQLASHKAELLQLQKLKAELEAEDVALLGRLQEMERSEVERRRDQEKKMFELQEVLREKDRLLDESLQQTEALRRELQRLKEDLQKMEEEEKENRGCEERIWRRQQQETEGEEEICSQDVSSPLRHNRRKSPKAVRRKRKSVEVEDLVFSENKRNRGRGGALSSRQEQKVTSVIFDSPSISKGKTSGLVEAVTTKSRRGRKKLLKTGPSTPLFESPQMALGGTDEDKESDHLIIQRKLRSKTYRK